MKPFSHMLKTTSPFKKSSKIIFDKKIQYLLNKRRESIINCMTRPLYQEALRSLYLVAVLFVDTLITLEIYLTHSSIINVVLALTVLGIFLYLELCIYYSLWGQYGRWSIEK
jgi:hypothetical protein